jgi:hypothetical protein
MVCGFGTESRRIGIFTVKKLRGLPIFTPAPPSPAATSSAHSRSPKAGALPHFPPMCRTAQTRSVPRSSFPNCRLRENRRSTPANLPACRSERVPPAPELQRRRQDRLCYAVRERQPFEFILLTATVRHALTLRQPWLDSPRPSWQCRLLAHTTAAGRHAHRYR